MNILIIGSGGREHALAWKIKQSPRLTNLYIAPGNGGTGELGTNLSLDINNANQIKQAVSDNKIDLLVFGPEEPLVRGMVDQIKSDKAFADLLIVGPAAEGAQLEGSKHFAKEFMEKYGIPTGKARVFSKNNLDEGLKFIEDQQPPFVLKADGLAAGKGVLITEDVEGAKQNLKDLILEEKFGAASANVLVEEFLSGIELSVFVVTDGKEYKILPEAKDYKRIGEKDTGLNTGGMGAISPVIFADADFMKKVEEKVIKPTVDGIAKEGMDFHGFIFFGLIKVKEEPYVIEYNVRMGDPETEVVIPRIKSDLVDLLEATANSTLNNIELVVDQDTAATVMMVAGGYPEKYEKGHEIQISQPAGSSIIFHAGTAIKDGKLVTNGGRVMAITNLGNDLSEALTKSYAGVEMVTWEGKNFRKDIGFDLQALGQ
ncbi:MAG: phosphoribosylamine--glycine ligase [Bacteroidota bacterium]